MMLDAAEMRRRWSDKTEASFTRADFHNEVVFGPEDQELELDFQGCQSIVFMDGDSTRGEDMLMLVRGSGHMTLPAGVQVRMTAGAFKYRAPAGSVVGSSHGPGYRAPPPTRATSYAGSSAPSGYRNDDRSQSSRETFRPSPPRDQAGFSRPGTHVGGYATSGRAPLPKSMAGTRSRTGDWEVVEQAEDQESWDDGRSSVAPSESISSVGSRGQRSSYNY
ncbi:hypothetical protein QBC39DRAFT_181436 [Podospora conica]|nr:hypothetical protein QBC39DRAFT_181436 [Schizothecium conicum]